MTLLIRPAYKNDPITTVICRIRGGFLCKHFDSMENLRSSLAGSRGIGLAIATLYAQAGAKVILN